MSLPIIFRPEALDDLSEAFQWHEEQRSGLGVDFMAAMIGGNLSVNWCAAVDAAGTAGYLLGRYYDTVSSRWFIVGEDGSGTRQASFIINPEPEPEPKRDLIVEAPHVYATNAKIEGWTDTEAVLILRQSLGRALLINGAGHHSKRTVRCHGFN